jgi:hypothetical protein
MTPKWQRTCARCGKAMRPRKRLHWSERVFRQVMHTDCMVSEISEGLRRRQAVNQ